MAAVNTEGELRAATDERLLRALIRNLRSPRSGLRGQVVRFGLAGGLVTLVYITVTSVLSQVFGMPFEAALAIGFVTALLLHFTLQRLFVWIHYQGFALSFGSQVGRYIAMATTQYGCTVASTAVLPGALGISTELVYLATMSIVTTAGFLLMRFVIFHPRSRVEDSTASSLDPSERQLPTQSIPTTGPPTPEDGARSAYGSPGARR
jgi:putative flippase GtrA